MSPLLTGAQSLLERSRLLPPERDMNALRYRGGGYVESYFVRANDPRRRRAVWLKSTILSPLAGEPVAESWFIYFDGERNRTFAHKETVPFRAALFGAGEGGEQAISIAGARMVLSAAGSAHGQVRGRQGVATWDLGWLAEAGRQGAPLTIYPSRLMVDGPFPKSKVLTPFPALRFSGSLAAFGEAVSLDGWTGMQGHNFGTQHHHVYTWGQCLFPATGGGPEAMVEGGTGRLKLGGWVTPQLSLLVVRRGAQEYRFDTTFDAWRQEATVSRWRWTTRLRSEDGEASLTMDAGEMPLACLGYQNPDGHLSYCFNTKLAHVWLHVQPKAGPGFSLESEHGGALELLQHAPDPQYPDVV